MIGELAALGAALSWTISAVLYKTALREAKPISANIVRLACTSIILAVSLAMIGKFGALASLSTSAVALASISGIVGLGLGDTLYMASLKLVGVVRAVPITCTYPLFNLLWAAFLIGEPVTLPVVIGAIIIVIGILLLSQEKRTDQHNLRKSTLTKGMVFALAAAIAWSTSITMIDIAVTLPEAGSIDSSLAINTIRTMAVTVCLLALAPIIDREFGFLKIQRKMLAKLVYGGIVALGLGWFLLTYSFLNTSEARAVPISSTTPLFSTLLGIIFLREQVTAKNVLGTMAIVAGIFTLFIV